MNKSHNITLISIKHQLTNLVNTARFHFNNCRGSLVLEVFELFREHKQSCRPLKLFGKLMCPDIVRNLQQAKFGHRMYDSLLKSKQHFLTSLRMRSSPRVLRLGHFKASIAVSLLDDDYFFLRNLPNLTPFYYKHDDLWGFRILTKLSFIPCL